MKTRALFVVIAIIAAAALVLQIGFGIYLGGWIDERGIAGPLDVALFASIGLTAVLLVLGLVGAARSHATGASRR